MKFICQVCSETLESISFYAYYFEIFAHFQETKDELSLTTSEIVEKAPIEFVFYEIFTNSLDS